MAATLRESGTSIPNNTKTVTATTWQAQTVLTADYFLSSIKLHGLASESSGNLVVEVWTDSGGNPSAFLVRAIVAKSSLPSGTADWYTVTFPSISLPGTSSYHIVLYTTSGSYVWSVRIPAGAAYWDTSTDSGATWGSSLVLGAYQIWGTDALVFTPPVFIAPGSAGFGSDGGPTAKCLVAVANSKVWYEDI